MPGRIIPPAKPAANQEVFTVVSQEVTQVTSLADVEPKMQLTGTVKQIQLAGAIVDVGIEECDALLHISQIRKRRVNNVRDVLEEGQEVSVWVRNVDLENTRLDVTMIEPAALGWDDIEEGQLYTGKVIRVEKYGAFVDIGAERPGLVHISEMAHGYINKPEDAVTKGEEIEVKVIGVNRSKRQIDLSMKAVMPEPETAAASVQEEDDKQEELPTAMALAIQRAQEMAERRAAEKTSGKGNKKATQQREQDDIIRRTLERHDAEN